MHYVTEYLSLQILPPRKYVTDNFTLSTNTIVCTCFPVSFGAGTIQYYQFTTEIIRILVDIEMLAKTFIG